MFDQVIETFNRMISHAFIHFCSQQGFGVLSVALASHALNLMAALLSDAQFESMMPVAPVEQAELSISANATALQRALTVLKAVPMSQFLFYLATVSYRKVGNHQAFLLKGFPQLEILLDVRTAN